MKRLYLALLLAGALACGGGGGSTPVTPPDDNTPPPINVTGGSFDVTSTSAFDGCNLPTDWNGTYDVQIDSTNVFKMGNFKGTFTPGTSTCKGETIHQRSTIRTCTTSKWTEVQIKFTSEDTFSGSIIYRYRVSGDCNSLTGCTSSWVINGVRVP